MRKEHGPHKALYTHSERWSGSGDFAQIMADLVAEHGEEKTVMINETYLKAYRTAFGVRVKY